ncbi:MAG: 30S ribosomal protein S1 [Candidatus Cloacimonetes bacterium]|nr:30S ribosomal protein S1 [Candidatus Cloacimonadota bacterium]
MVEEPKELEQEKQETEETATTPISEEITEIETKEEVPISEEPQDDQKPEEKPTKKASIPIVPETPESAALAKEMAQYEETFRDYKPGEIIEGIIVGFNDKEVLVDISYKSEGSIPISDFSGAEEIKLNSKIKVYINKIENSEGKVSLSKKIADFHLALDDLKETYKNNQTVTGVIRQRVKGGMIAEIKGLTAFLPGSQISIKPIPNLDQFIGKEVKFRIINIDEQKKNIIVSRKKVLEEEQEEKIEKLRDKIKIGAELDGEVKNITDYGAFIDLGGIDGLLHITDMSWGHISHPSEMLNISDKVKVKVIGYEEEEARVSLGLKQLVPHPWENVELKYEEGTKVTGKVVNVTPYGAFVELEPGVEGLVHISEMSWTKKITNPRQLLNVGDTVNAIVLSVSKDDQKISLGMKQMEPNPWLVIDERYPVGSLIKGKIKSLTSFGAFVEIEEDIDGLIHISDVSWTKRIYHPKEVLKKGQEVETVVLSVDKHLHRIALGMKQLLPDPWEELDQKLPINTEVTGVITKIIPKGVLVDIDVDGTPIEGFVPISHLAIPRLDRPEMAFNLGDEIPMKVIELDMENRRLILSIKAYFFSKEREALQEFLKMHEPEMRQQMKKEEEEEHAEESSDVHEQEPPVEEEHDESTEEVEISDEEQDNEQSEEPETTEDSVMEEAAALETDEEEEKPKEMEEIEVEVTEPPTSEEVEQEEEVAALEQDSPEKPVEPEK